MNIFEMGFYFFKNKIDFEPIAKSIYSQRKDSNGKLTYS